MALLPTLLRCILLSMLPEYSPPKAVLLERNLSPMKRYAKRVHIDYLGTLAEYSFN
jgi:hypothetical protein